jgi:hypothetical protein
MEAGKASLRRRLSPARTSARGHCGALLIWWGATCSAAHGRHLPPSMHPVFWNAYLNFSFIYSLSASRWLGTFLRLLCVVHLYRSKALNQLASFAPLLSVHNVNYRYNHNVVPPKLSLPAEGHNTCARAELCSANVTSPRPTLRRHSLPRGNVEATFISIGSASFSSALPPVELLTQSTLYAR